MSDHDRRLDFANVLRGPAALFVLISHVWHNAWYMRPLVESLANVQMPSETVVPTPNYIKVLGSIPHFEWGGYGVGIFFLISGAVIPLSLKKYSSEGFLAGRVFRIWPVYIAGFSVTLLAILIAGLHFGKPFPYRSYDVVSHYLPGLHDLLRSPGIDGVIWTLEIEVKFYVLCVLAAPLLRRMSAVVFLVPAFIALACFACMSHSTPPLFIVLALSGQFIIFMFIGTAFVYWREGAILCRSAMVIGSLLLAAFLALVLWGPVQSLNVQPGSYIAAVATFLFFAWKWKRKSKIADFFSSISYPLYASHPAVGYFVVALALQGGLSPWTSMVTASIVVITIATVIHALVEVPSHRAGQRIARRMTQSSLAITKVSA